MSHNDCYEPDCQSPKHENSRAQIELLIQAKPKDLGGFTVRRALPSIQRKTVGPFVFWDHMGPSVFAEGKGIDVRPHPHIGLATLTYLFDGEIMHRDSLGCVERIVPGEVNWMVAGRGIVHSERTPSDLRETGFRLHGLQIWIALPKSKEETDPAFFHFEKEEIPRLEKSDVDIRVVAGKAFGVQSPVPVASPLFYVHCIAKKDATFVLPPEYKERAAYLVHGKALVGQEPIEEGSMAIFQEGESIELKLEKGTNLMLFGGEPFPEKRHVWWNLVSSSVYKIAKAKEDWKEGRFAPVPGETDFIPLPED